MQKFIVSKETMKDNGDGSYTVFMNDMEKYVPSEYTAISPLDGRYADTGRKLSPYFSEFALVKNRVKVEVLWLKFLLDHLSEGNDVLSSADRSRTNYLECIYEFFSVKSFFEIKEIEAVTNHDVKSVEIWVGKQVEDMDLAELKSYVHIGCTSEDITNSAYARMIQDALREVWIPGAMELLRKIEELAKKYQNLPMLAYTHGQPATPTTLGKEMAVYAYRIRNAIERVNDVQICAKFNGATGNYAAISAAFPDECWPDLAKEFVEEYLELDFNPITTQIESHDYIVEIAAGMAHFNRIVANFCSDMWTYISMELFKQIPVKTEVGSSTMPHKVNPINFENGEANLRKSTADLEFLREWLMSSRMQRDLRDSTTLRNIGPAFGHSLLGIERTLKGLKKVEVNEQELERRLNGKWEVLAEAVQTLLRKYGVSDAYNRLKEITRGQNITEEALHEFMNSKELEVIPEDERKRLLDMNPSDYIGLAAKIVDDNI